MIPSNKLGAEKVITKPKLRTNRVRATDPTTNHRVGYSLIFNEFTPPSELEKPQIFLALLQP